MQLSKHHDSPQLRNSRPLIRPSRHVPWTRRCAAIFFMGAVIVAAQQSQPGGQGAQPNGSTPSTEPGPGRSWATTPEIKIVTPQPGTANYDPANVERKKQIADETARLLKLATELKAEVDKTDKDTLSLNVIRKAEEIEKLAHDVKEKMKLSAGPN